MSKTYERFYKKALDYFRTGTDGKGIPDYALCMAIDALKKQIPRRIEDKHSDTVCPACKRRFYIEDLNVVKKARYCYECGQRLEWH